MRNRPGSVAAIVGMTAVVSLLGWAPNASASFHEIKVREVFPGSVANPDSDYVVLQAYSAGQNIVSAGQLRIYNADGTTATTFMPSGNVASPSNQMTVLIADSTYATQFPMGAAPDFTTSTLNLSPSAGAVCWPVNSSPIDCVSWGAFMGAAMLPAPGSSSPAASIADGMAITRSIAGGCSTLLQDTQDDTNNSSTDFSAQTPAPRNNGSPIMESNCTLNVSITGSGSVTGNGINCPGDCTQTFFNGESVGLVPAGVNGGTFIDWTNCPLQVGDDCQLDMGVSRAVTANFTAGNPPPVTPTPAPAPTPTAAPTSPPKKKKCKKRKKRSASAAKKCKKRK